MTKGQESALWRKNNPERYKIYKLRANTKKREENYRNRELTTKEAWQKRLLISTNRNSRNKKIEHNIEIGDIIIPDLCPLLRKEFTYVVTGKSEKYNPSIDRIDPSKGYIIGNIQVISFLANTMKNNATKEQQIIFAQNVLKIHKKNS